MKEYAMHPSGAKIRCHDIPGDETTIIFIHGLGCASSMDYPQVASFHGLRRHRRILIDLFGSAFSDKPSDFEYTIESHAECLQELIKTIGIDSCYIFGHSMGGSIAISLAARCAIRIEGIMLGEANLDSGGGFFSNKIAAYTEEDYCSFGHDEIIKEARKDSNGHWAAGLENSSPGAIFREATSLVAGTTPSWRELLYSLDTRKTFIFGEHSLPAPDVSELEQQGVHIEVVKKAGHSMAWDNPDGLAAAIANAVLYSKSAGNEISPKV